MLSVYGRAVTPVFVRLRGSLQRTSLLVSQAAARRAAPLLIQIPNLNVQMRSFSTRSHKTGKKSELVARPTIKSLLEQPQTRRMGHPDYSPIPVLSKEQISQITTTNVGSENLNITERDILEIDSLGHRLSSMLEDQFDEDVLLNLKDYNVDKLLSRVKGTLHVDDVPATIKAIRVLSAQDRVDDALALWNILKQQPQHCTLFAWTAYLNTLCTHGKSDLALKEIKDMVLSGVTPDHHVYGILVKGLVSEGRLNDAYALTREMTESGLRPNNVIFASLIYGCIKKHQLTRANETFDLMRNYVEEPDSISIALMIKVAEFQHNTERAMRLFDSLEVHHQLVTRGCYHAIMHACAHSWRYDVMAFDYFKKMELAGIEPNLQSFHILLEACSTQGDFVRANSVLMQLQEQGLKPTAETCSLVLRVLGSAAGNGLAMPEHPAGDRRYTREEYRTYLEGFPIMPKRDRLAYVRDYRSKMMDDGLGETEVEESSGGLHEVDEEHESHTNQLIDKMGAEIEDMENPKESLLKTARESLQKVSPGGGMSSGLSEDDIKAEIDKIEGRAVQPTEPSKSLQERTEEAVMEKYMVEPTETSSEASSTADKMIQSMRERGLIPRGADIEKLRHQQEAVASLIDLEKEGRSLLMKIYKEKGGDEKNIDYSSDLWKSCVEEVLAKKSTFQTGIQNMVKFRIGTTLLAGANLLKQKEEADKLFVEEVQFLRSCFMDSPDKAKQLTQLRVAQLMKSEILDNYEILRAVEPDIRYQTPHSSFLTLQCPNRVYDLSEYWKSLYHQDLTVPPLKTYLVKEGERIWSELMKLSGNKPSIVQINSYLGLYSKALFFNRAKSVFNSIENYNTHPDAMSYHLIITMYAKTKHIPEAAQYMREMQLKGLTPAPETYGEMVLALTRVGDIDRALAVMTDIKRQKLPWPKERYLRPLRMQLNRLKMRDHPSMPEDKEAKWRKEYHLAVRKDSSKGNAHVQHAANAK